VDDELERARRGVREAPDDLGAALRLASACERARCFVEGWTAVVRLVGRSDDDAAALSALGRLASRNPGPMVAYLRQIDEDRARFSCVALGRARELLPLVVLACADGEDTRLHDARVALHTALAGDFHELPKVDLLEHFVTRRNQLFRGVAARHEEVGRVLITRARVERGFVLLPWLWALSAAQDASLAADAIAAFRELSGRLAPPVDPDDLSRRWTR